MPWLHTWWSQVLGFMRRLLKILKGCLHLDILEDNITDARQRSSCSNWSKGIEMQFCSLGMEFTFRSAGIGVLNGHGLMTKMARQ